MTGFIRGLFGGKRNNPGEDPDRQADGSFYLDPDDAKTYGNIDYMRTAKTVKRTFARKRGQTEELESVRQISAMDSASLEEQQKRAEQPTSEVVSNGRVENETKFKRRTADSNLDMFRNMARDMKK